MEPPNVTIVLRGNTGRTTVPRGRGSRNIRRMASTQPLFGLRVLDCTSWFGALGGRLLADAGADVLRVVSPRGAPFELEPPFFGSSKISIQDAWYNAGKRVLTLDLDSPEGRSGFEKLLAGADILIEEWVPNHAPMSAAELGKVNPRLARVSVSPMGLTGPRSGWAVTDLVANALSGASSVTGDAESGPLNGYGNQTYNTVGLYAAVCALAAHRAASQTGEAQHVDLSAHESLVSCTEQVLMEWFFPDGAWQTPIAPRQGSLHWTNAYEVYPSKDGHGIMVTAALRFADVLLPWLIEEGAEQDLADATKYPSLLAILQDLPHVMHVIRQWVASRDAEYLFFEGQRRHQPMGIVWDIAEAMESPQIAAREYLTEQTIPGFGAVKFPGRFFRSSADGPPPGPPTRVARDVGWEPRDARQPSTGSATASAPLAGVRILDFTHVLAGPFGTRVLGDLGADVIKVGTAARGAGANTPDHPYYMCWNRNKRSISVNMASEEGRGFARKLAGQCDVIIENFSAGVLKRWGLDRAGLESSNPGVSVVSMGGMGQTGPWKDFVTFAPTIHALTGLTYLTNPAGRHDMGYGFSLTDHLSGLAGALASMEALEYRQRTGEGLTVDLSQYELGLGLMGPAILGYFANGTNPAPAGNRHPFGQFAPHGLYRCAGDDEWVAIAVRGDDQWNALRGALGEPAIVNDAMYATHEGRVANVDALDAMVTRWTRSRQRSEVAALLQAVGVAAGSVQDARDLAERDPQLAARGFFGTLRTEGRGDYGYDKFPALFNGQRPAANDGVHLLGADTFDVATGLLGLSDDEVTALLADGVLT